MVDITVEVGCLEAVLNPITRLKINPSYSWTAWWTLAILETLQCHMARMHQRVDIVHLPGSGVNSRPVIIPHHWRPSSFRVRYVFCPSPVLSLIEALYNRFIKAWLTEAGVALVKSPYTNYDHRLGSFHPRFILLQARSQALLLPTVHHQVTCSYPDHWFKC